MSSSSVVVSDASPLIALAQIGQLNLLPALFGQVWIPPAVQSEIASQVPVFGWLVIRAPQAVPEHLAVQLDAGEAEAIALAIDHHALLILDEVRGRDLAGRLGLQTVGTMGLLIRAKMAGLIPAVRPFADELIGKHHFWVSAALHEKTLRLANEL